MFRRGLLAALLLAALAHPAQAQNADNGGGALAVVACGTLPLAYQPGPNYRQTVDLNGNLCVTGSISASTAALAQSALPSLVPGTNSIYESLSGGLYVQPIYGQAVGGPLQVNTTNGLPIQGTAGGQAVPVSGAISCNNCGGASITTVTTTQGTIPWIVSGTVTTTPSGTQSVSSTGQINVYVLGTPTVSTTGQQTVLVGGTVSVSSTGKLTVSVDNTPSVSTTGQQTVYIGGQTTASDGLGNPTASQVLGYLLGWDPTNSVWRRAQVAPGTGAQMVSSSGTLAVSSTGQTAVSIIGTPSVSTTGLAGVVVVNTPSVSSTGVQAVNVVNAPSVSTTGLAGVVVVNTPSVSTTGQASVGVTQFNGVPVTPTVKATQGTNLLPVQSAVDSGRTAISLYTTTVSSGASGVETLVGLMALKGTTTSTIGAYTITSGKTLRLTSVLFGTANSAATAQTSTFSLRINTAGACSAAAGTVMMQARTSASTTPASFDRVPLVIPDGFEIAGNGTVTICVTASANFTGTGPKWDVDLIGFEY